MARTMGWLKPTAVQRATYMFDVLSYSVARRRYVAAGAVTTSLLTLALVYVFVFQDSLECLSGSSAACGVCLS